MIINQHELLVRAPIVNMLTTKVSFKGFSHGLSECGYDIRIKEPATLFLGRRFILRSSVEYFHMPSDLMGRILNKSTWARKGIDASMTTNIEPGWRGYLTIELRYSGILPITIPAGVGIAQVIFETISVPVKYKGKYDNQPSRPIKAIVKNMEDQ